jgi:hypothetical protein
MSKWRACSSFSLTSRRLFTKNSPRQAKQSIPHTSVKFCGDCVNMWEDFTLNFAVKELAVPSQQYTVSHFLFHRDFFFY